MSGCPLAVAFAERGFPVIGIDVDAHKVEALNLGESYVQDIPSERLAAIVTPQNPAAAGSPAIAGTLRATTDYAALEGCDAAIICVPTPLNKTRDPDVRFVISAGESVAQHIHPGMLVALESTTYPGTTEELLLPMLTSRTVGERLNVGRFNVGTDFFLASPPSASTPATSAMSWKTRPKWWRSLPPVATLRLPCTVRPSNRSCRSHPRRRPRWSNCWKTLSAP